MSNSDSTDKASAAVDEAFLAAFREEIASPEPTIERLKKLFAVHPGLQSAPSWRPIKTAPNHTHFCGKKVDLWLEITPSPRSMGMGDSFRVIDCWQRNGKWVHLFGGKIEELQQDYITHWMPIAEPTNEEIK